jgi:hypothetical protein
MKPFRFTSISRVSFLIFVTFTCAILAETNKEPRDPNVPTWLGDFKKLDAQEYAQKKEGWYTTGFPLFGSDAVLGTGVGVLANIFYNGSKSTPSFGYVPYEHQIAVGAYQTNRSTKSYFVTWDAPFFLDTPFRVKTYLGHDTNLHNQYFGTGKESLSPLSYLERNQSEGRTIRNATYSDFETANSYYRNKGVGQEAVSTQRYHEYQFETTYAQFFLDKTVQKVFRIWGGTEVSKNVVRRYDATWTEARDPLTDTKVKVQESSTLVTNDARSGKIIGENGGIINYLRAGIAYDTRDYEPDPDSGWLIEYNINRAERAIGSDFSYLRHFVQAKNYWQPFPKLFEELVIAQRVALTKAEGNVPFFEYRYLYSIDGPFGGVGGQNTLRGYRSERFFGPVMGFYNFELRWRFGSFEMWDSLFQFSLVPFYDVANVWDKLKEINTQGYKHSRGLGIRIVWDQSTVILMDWARSREDSLFYLDMGHTF